MLGFLVPSMGSCLSWGRQGRGILSTFHGQPVIIRWPRLVIASIRETSWVQRLGRSVSISTGEEVSTFNVMSLIMEDTSKEADGPGEMTQMSRLICP